MAKVYRDDPEASPIVVSRYNTFGNLDDQRSSAAQRDSGMWKAGNARCRFVMHRRTQPGFHYTHLVRREFLANHLAVSTDSYNPGQEVVTPVPEIFRTSYSDVDARLWTIQFFAYQNDVPTNSLPAAAIAAPTASIFTEPNDEMLMGTSVNSRDGNHPGTNTGYDAWTAPLFQQEVDNNNTIAVPAYNPEGFRARVYLFAHIDADDTATYVSGLEGWDIHFFDDVGQVNADNYPWWKMGTRVIASRMVEEGASSPATTLTWDGLSGRGFAMMTGIKTPFYEPAEIAGVVEPASGSGLIVVRDARTTPEIYASCSMAGTASVDLGYPRTDKEHYAQVRMDAETWMGDRGTIAAWPKPTYFNNFVRNYGFTLSGNGQYDGGSPSIVPYKLEFRSNQKLPESGAAARRLLGIYVFVHDRANPSMEEWPGALGNYTRAGWGTYADPSHGTLIYEVWYSVHDGSQYPSDPRFDIGWELDNADDGYQDEIPHFWAGTLLYYEYDANLHLASEPLVDVLQSTRVGSTDRHAELPPQTVAEPVVFLPMAISGDNRGTFVNEWDDNLPRDAHAYTALDNSNQYGAVIASQLASQHLSGRSFPGYEWDFYADIEAPQALLLGVAPMIAFPIEGEPEPLTGEATLEVREARTTPDQYGSASLSASSSVGPVKYPVVSGAGGIDAYGIPVTLEGKGTLAEYKTATPSAVHGVEFQFAGVGDPGNPLNYPPFEEDPFYNDVFWVPVPKHEPGDVIAISYTVGNNNSFDLPSAEDFEAAYPGSEWFRAPEQRVRDSLWNPDDNSDFYNRHVLYYGLVVDTQAEDGYLKSGSINSSSSEMHGQAVVVRGCDTSGGLATAVGELTRFQPDGFHPATRRASLGYNAVENRANEPDYESVPGKRQSVLLAVSGGGTSKHAFAERNRRMFDHPEYGNNLLHITNKGGSSLFVEGQEDRITVDMPENNTNFWPQGMGYDPDPLKSQQHPFTELALYSAGWSYSAYALAFVAPKKYPVRSGTVRVTSASTLEGTESEIEDVFGSASLAGAWDIEDIPRVRDSIDSIEAGPVGLSGEGYCFGESKQFVKVIDVVQIVGTNHGSDSYTYQLPADAQAGDHLIVHGVYSTWDGSEPPGGPGSNTMQTPSGFELLNSTGGYTIDGLPPEGGQALFRRILTSPSGSHAFSFGAGSKGDRRWVLTVVLVRFADDDQEFSFGSFDEYTTIGMASASKPWQGSWPAGSVAMSARGSTDSDTRRGTGTDTAGALYLVFIGGTPGDEPQYSYRTTANWTANDPKFTRRVNEITTVGVGNTEPYEGYTTDARADAWSGGFAVVPAVPQYVEPRGGFNNPGYVLGTVQFTPAPGGYYLGSSYLLIEPGIKYLYATGAGMPSRATLTADGDIYVEGFASLSASSACVAAGEVQKVADAALVGTAAGEATPDLVLRYAEARLIGLGTASTPPGTTIKYGISNTLPGVGQLIGRQSYLVSPGGLLEGVIGVVLDLLCLLSGACQLISSERVSLVGEADIFTDEIVPAAEGVRAHSVNYVGGPSPVLPEVDGIADVESGYKMVLFASAALVGEGDFNPAFGQVVDTGSVIVVRNIVDENTGEITGYWLVDQGLRGTGTLSDIPTVREQYGNPFTTLAVAAVSADATCISHAEASLLGRSTVLAEELLQRLNISPDSLHIDRPPALVGEALFAPVEPRPAVRYASIEPAPATVATLTATANRITWGDPAGVGEAEGFVGVWGQTKQTEGTIAETGTVTGVRDNVDGFSGPLSGSIGDLQLGGAFWIGGGFAAGRAFLNAKPTLVYHGFDASIEYEGIADLASDAYGLNYASASLTGVGTQTKPTVGIVIPSGNNFFTAAAELAGLGTQDAAFLVERTAGATLTARAYFNPEALSTNFGEATLPARATVSPVKSQAIRPVFAAGTLSTDSALSAQADGQDKKGYANLTGTAAVAATARREVVGGEPTEASLTVTGTLSARGYEALNSTVAFLDAAATMSVVASEGLYASASLTGTAELSFQVTHNASAVVQGRGRYGPSDRVRAYVGRSQDIEPFVGSASLESDRQVARTNTGSSFSAKATLTITDPYQQQYASSAQTGIGAAVVSARQDRYGDLSIDWVGLVADVDHYVERYRAVEPIVGEGFVTATALEALYGKPVECLGTGAVTASAYQEQYGDPAVLAVGSLLGEDFEPPVLPAGRGRGNAYDPCTKDPELRASRARTNGMRSRGRSTLGSGRAKRGSPRSRTTPSEEA